MKILSLNIISFGKLENLSLELSQRTVIQGSNGAGKSTVAAFIRIMLFGPERSDRRRYLPWNGKAIQGGLTFEQDGTEYSIFRTIGVSGRGDSCEFTLTKTGEKIAGRPADIIGSGGRTFSQTAYVPQSSTVFSGGQSLGAELRGAVFGSGINAENALKIIDSNRRLISNPRGRLPGSLDAVNMQLEKLNENYSLILSRKNSLPGLQSQLEACQKELEENRRLYTSAAAANAAGETERLEMESAAVGERMKNLESRLAAEASESSGRGSLFSKALIIAACIFIIAAAVLMFKTTAAAAICLTAAIISAAAGIFFLNGRQAAKKAYTEEADGIKTEISILEKKKRRLDERLLLLRENDSPELQLLSDKINSISDRAAYLREEIRRLNEENPEKLLAEINEKKAEAELLSRRLDDLSAAAEGINSALKKLGESWLPGLARDVSEKAGLILGRELRLLIDDELNIKVLENGPKGIEYFSGGERDAVYLALRLTAAELIFGRNHPPLILDDPFVQYDEMRTENSLKMLEKISEKNQIIIFTCKNSAVFENKGFRLLTI